MVTYILIFIMFTITTVIHPHPNDKSGLKKKLSTKNSQNACFNKTKGPPFIDPNLCPTLIFPVKDRIKYFDLTTNTLHDLNIPKIRQVAAIELDMQNKCVFWTDIKTHTIGRQCFNGYKSTDIFLSKDLGLVEGLAYDWISQNLYFTDSLHSTIELIRININLSTQMRKIILDIEDVEKPRGIAIHPAVGYLFWTDSSSDYPCVGRSNLDGNHVKKLFSKPQVLLPNGIAVDYISEKIFWVDTHLEYIASADFDGGKWKKIVENNKFVAYPFGVALFKDNVFWNDGIFYGIYNSSSYYSNTIGHVLKGVSSSFDLKVYSRSVQEGTNASVRASCTHLCVGMSEQNYTCLCPDGLEMFNEMCIPTYKAMQLYDLICPAVSFSCGISNVYILMFVIVLTLFNTMHH